MKQNYQLVLEKTLKALQAEDKRPSLLLHSCCGPCSSYVMEYLAQYFDITIFYYNPNISPAAEFQFRAEEQQRLIREMDLGVSFLLGKYEPERFFSLAKGHEAEPEGGERCGICFEMRLREAAKLAAEGGYDWFTTTLTISPLKNAGRLNTIGQAMGEEYHVAFLPSDFKKKEGYKRSIELSAQYHLYRQNYCGCVFSKREREEQMQKERQETS